MNPPRFLKTGHLVRVEDDVVRVEIEGTGHIGNRVIDEPENTFAGLTAKHSGLMAGRDARPTESCGEIWS
jgi:hypothetical protein